MSKYHITHRIPVSLAYNRMKWLEIDFFHYPDEDGGLGPVMATLIEDGMPVKRAHLVPREEDKKVNIGELVGVVDYFFHPFTYVK